MYTMLNIFYIIPLITFWNSVSSEISSHIDNKTITNDIVSAIHCLAYIIHYNYYYNMDYMIHASFAYFIHDLIHIFSCLPHVYSVKPRSEYLTNCVYIGHHLLGLYLLDYVYTSPDKYLLLSAYHMLELSNITLYISLVVSETTYASNFTIMAITELVHLLWYSYIRVFIGTLFVYHNFDYFLQLSRFNQFSMFMLYALGICYTYLLVKRNIDNVYTFRTKNIKTS